MAGALVAALAAPIREVRALVGPGYSDDPAVLAGARDALTEVAAAVGRAERDADAHWSGAAATGAAEFAASTASAAHALAARAEQLRDGAQAAASAVARADARLQAIVERFEACAAALEPRLDASGVAEELLAEAQRSLAEAIAVVDELRDELDGQAHAVTAAAAPGSPAPTTPAGFSTAALPSGGAALGGTPFSTPAVGGGLSGPGPLSGLGESSGWGPPSGLGGSSGLAELASLSSHPPETAVPAVDPGRFGDGVAVRLPDGSTAMAPNAVAASAVRHALTQLGVPYRWGGTTPGAGLDCSGLTQWAYHEAGLDIPRLAQEQDVGAAVDAGSLRPGDLAVWDGHVAMVVGNGLMIEAGDPVQLSPIRTTNAGQGFHGFFRPTA